jgi:hypothetical protein
VNLTDTCSENPSQHNTRAERKQPLVEGVGVKAYQVVPELLHPLALFYGVLHAQRRLGQQGWQVHTCPRSQFSSMTLIGFSSMTLIGFSSVTLIGFSAMTLIGFSTMTLIEWGVHYIWQPALGLL